MGKVREKKSLLVEVVKEGLSQVKRRPDSKARGESENGAWPEFIVHTVKWVRVKRTAKRRCT